MQRALEKSGIEITPDLSSRVAVTYSSAIGGLDAVLKADRRLISKNAMPHPFINPNACINMVGGNISILTGFHRPYNIYNNCMRYMPYVNNHGINALGVRKG